MKVSEAVQALVKNLVNYLKNVPQCEEVVKKWSSQILKMAPTEQVQLIKTMTSMFEFPEDVIDRFFFVEHKIDRSSIAPEHYEKGKKYIGALMDIVKDAD
jgi:hypothetical protein